MLNQGKNCDPGTNNKDQFQRQSDDLANILDQAHDILYRFNFLTNQYDYVSGNVEQTTGFTPQEIMETGADILLESLHPKDRPQLMEIFNGLIHNTIDASDLHLEYRAKHKDGHYVHRSDNMKIIRNEDNRVIAVVGTARDITDDQQTEQQLLNTEQRYKRLAEATFEGIAIHDKGIILDVNQQYCEMFGYAPDEIIGIDGIKFTTTESEAIIRDNVAKGFEEPYKVTCRRKDGSTFPVEIRARSTFWDNNPVRIATFRDLSETAKLQQELAASEKKYRDLYENANVALFRTALDGTLLECNRAAWDFFGHPYEKEDKIPKNYSVTEAYVDPARRKNFVQTLQKKGFVKHFEAQLRRADGSVFWAAISATLNLEQGCIEGALYDITIEKLLTKTEKEILGQLMKGKTNKEIAFQTGRSIRTIEDHRAHIMQKLGVDNLVDLTKKAMSFDPPSQ